MENNQKTVFSIHLINKWYIIISLVLILMQYLNIINVHPIWLLFPIWIPFLFVFILFITIYILKGIVYLIDYKKGY